MSGGEMVQITRGDGLIDREQAAELCGVTPDAVTIWSTRGYWVVVNGEKQHRKLPVAKREGRKPLYELREVQIAEHATRKRGIHARTRRPRYLGELPLAA